MDCCGRERDERRCAEEGRSSGGGEVRVDGVVLRDTIVVAEKAKGQGECTMSVQESREVRV